MRVLLLADGRSVHTIRYQAELKKQGVDVLLVSLEDGNTVDVKLKCPTGINGLDYAVASQTIKKISQKENFDIINPHFASGYGFMTALSGLWKTKPVVLHCLGSDILVSPKKSWLHRWRIKYSLKKANQLIVDSNYLGVQAQKIYDKTDYKVIFWGADSSAFDSFEKKVKNNFVWNNPVKIIVPRAHYAVYNNRFIIHALKDMIKSNNVTVTFPLWGSDNSSFKELVKSEQLEQGVKYYDYKSRAEYNQFLAGFDIYLSASLSDSSPASLIEAMAAGLYPMVGDIPGVREWVDGTNGALYSLDDPVSLKKAFEEILEQSFSLSDVLVENNLKAKNEGLFSKNIKETIIVMQERIKNFGAKK